MVSEQFLGMGIPFNIPCSVGTENDWVQAAIRNGHISGNGPFGRKVRDLFREAYGFQDSFLTHSCTGALEMAAMLCAFAPGDEVILPSFTHVGTANAFARAGATLVFADSRADHPNVDAASIAACITPRTRAIVVVHYAGVACDMQAITALARNHGLRLVEDAAHAIGAQYQGRWLGSFGDFATFSFHETKNITCGQGGLLVVNDVQCVEQAAILWENGTNRAAFFRGEVGQYTWVGLGSCFTLSDLNAAYLYGQMLHKEAILARRLHLWARYRDALADLAAAGHFSLPTVAGDCTANGHIFYLRMPDRARREALIAYLRQRDVLAVFHYIPLHSSPYFGNQHDGRALPQCEAWSDCIIRLPMYDSLKAADQDLILEVIAAFCVGKA
jgi:dTDP-4-amino-4,6-dideoxygalactose transaminase